ncbi:MAG: GldM family protein [Bacteroidota bacterium]
MKKVLIIVIYVLFYGIANGQGKVRLINLMATHSVCDTIYIGIDNYIKIVSNNDKQKSFTNIKIDSGKFTLKHDTISIVPILSHFLKITVYDNLKVVDTIILKVKRVPSPIAAFGYFDDWKRNSVTKKKILENKRVKVSLEKFPYKICSICAKVQSFDIEINGITFSINGDLITDEALKLIAKAKPGDEIKLKKMKCTSLTGIKGRQLLDMTYTLE